MDNVIKIEIIENYVKENNLSKNKFCKKCKISSSTFEKIIKNNTNFGIVALFKIAREINIGVHQLFSNKIKK